MHGPTPLRIAFDEQASNFKDQYPWLLLALAVVIVTCIVVYLLLVCVERCLTPKNPANEYKRPGRRYAKAYVRLGLIGFAFLVLAFGLWTAAQMFGLQFFSILLTYGLVTLIATYTFSTALQSTGAFLFLNVTAKVSEEDSIVIEGTRVEGTVIYIGILYTTLLTATQELVHVPNIVLMTNIVRVKTTALPTVNIPERTFGLTGLRQRTFIQ